jgi:hypothetical protein
MGRRKGDESESFAQTQKELDQVINFFEDVTNSQTQAQYSDTLRNHQKTPNDEIAQYAYIGRIQLNIGVILRLGKLTPTELSQELGVDRRELWRWRKFPTDDWENLSYRKGPNLPTAIKIAKMAQFWETMYAEADADLIDSRTSSLS